jgi:N-methylhydantoinase A
MSDGFIMDMGGTSLDVSVIRSGKPIMSRALRVADQPIGVPGVEVQSIGSGGGSVAYIDPGGALRVGPRSAGADPGPACYDRGGVHPTVTDANVVLGYLSPTRFLGGRRLLSVENAERAIGTQIAERLGISLMDASAGIVEVVNADMARALRGISIGRGMDPRTFTLVCAGGAGGLHAARLARMLDIRRVIVPRVASAFCAFGMTVADVRHDHGEALRVLLPGGDVDAADAVLTRLEKRAVDELRREGFTDERIVIEREVDARYLNQIHELTISVPIGSVTGVDEAALVNTFHEEHRRRYRYQMTDVLVEALHWRVVARGITASDARVAPQRRPDPREDSGSRDVSRNAYCLDDRAIVTMPVATLDGLRRMGSVDGPAIIEAPDTTILVHRYDHAEAMSDDAVLIHVRGKSAP